MTAPNESTAVVYTPVNDASEGDVPAVDLER